LPQSVCILVFLFLNALIPDIYFELVRVVYAYSGGTSKPLEFSVSFGSEEVRVKRERLSVKLGNIKRGGGVCFLIPISVFCQ